MNDGYPLKYREERKNDIENDQTNQTIVQSDIFNTRITRYMGPVRDSMIEKDKGFNLYIENAEHVSKILLFKFKADIDINLTTHLKWVLFPNEPITQRVYLRYRTFNNIKVFRNVPCEKQLDFGFRHPVFPLRAQAVAPVSAPIQIEDRPSSDPNAPRMPETFFFEFV